MQEQVESQLKQTRDAFYKLQDNFNHNLLVIKELEQQNEKLNQQCCNIKTQYHQQIDKLQGVIQEIKGENNHIKYTVNMEIERVRSECEEQMQRIVDMMNEKMMEEKKFQTQKHIREKRQSQSETLRLEENLKYSSQQNSKLIQTVKQLRIEKESLESELSAAITQKQSYTNKFAFHEKQLQNMRNANEQWQKVLKDKIKQTNKQKQKIEQELSELKLSNKLKIKTIKDEACKKIQQIEINKQKIMKQIVKQSKQIKYKYDNLIQQIEKIKLENRNYGKQKIILQNTIHELSKQNGLDKQIEYLKKIHLQQKNQLINQNKLIQNQKNMLKDQLKQVHQRRQQVEKTVERLKTGFLSAQKQIGDTLKQNKKLQKQIKQLKKLAADGSPKIGNLLNQKYPNDDLINENLVTASNHIQYSKYFSQDMGPVDEMFFIQNSMPKQQKNIQKQSSVNHQLMKKIGQLQVEIDNYKNIIKSITQELQKIKFNHSQQLMFKDQEIQLGRSQVQLLRQKINQRQQQLLVLNSIRQQLQDKQRKLQDNMKTINDLQKKDISATNTIASLQQQLATLKQSIGETEDKLKFCEDEKKILDQINQQLRGEIHQLKNNARQFDLLKKKLQDSYCSQFQQKQASQNNIQNTQQQLKRTPHIIDQKDKNNGSRSRSGPRSNNQISQVTNENNGNKISIKLKDLVMKKKILEMEGKKINMEYRQVNSFKNIQTVSQKQVLDNLKKTSKSKEKQFAEKMGKRKNDYDKLVRMRVNPNEEEHIIF